ncbi:MAG: Uma2 family endonuclease [Planctomycetaceae bacterium]
MASVVTSEIESAPLPMKRGEPAWNLAFLFPRQGAWTEADYLELNTNQLVELSDGCLEVPTLPFPWHQWMVRFLHRMLDDFVRAHAEGEVFFAPLPIRLWPGQIRDPDVVYLRPERLRDMGKIPDGADLVIEVVSEGEENRERDLTIKPEEYAKAAISEYWIVDPEQEQLTVLTLDGDRYRQHGCFGADDEATSVLLPGFAVPVKLVFEVPEQPAE